MPESSVSRSHSHRNSACLQIRHLALIHASWSFIDMKDQEVSFTRLADGSPHILNVSSLRPSPSDKSCAPTYIGTLSTETDVDPAPYAFNSALSLVHAGLPECAESFTLPPIPWLYAGAPPFHFCLMMRMYPPRWLRLNGARLSATKDG